MSISISIPKFRTLSVLVTFFVAIAFIAPEFSPFYTGPAYAQVKKPQKRKNIFEILFGKRNSISPRNIRKKAKRVKLRNRRPQKKRRTVARKPAPIINIVQKNENAAKILVAGDFMASGLASGLTQAYADNPDIIIVNISKGLSGFVRDDVKNWPADIAAHIAEVKPIAVVFLNGMNDRQQMRLKTGKISKLSEPWLKEYNNRTKSLALSIQGQKLPFIWMGLPPVRPGKMSTDYLVFNEIYRTQAEAVNGVYVDVWDGFTNAEGQFVSAGPDINGQIKRLRNADGINMSRVGKRKLAFYARKAIRKLTGIGTPALLVSLPGIEDTGPIEPQYDPAKTGKTIVYSLAGPALDGGSQLAGGKSPQIEDDWKNSVSYKLVYDGVIPKTYPGRVDHYGIVANEVPKEVPQTAKSKDVEATPEIAVQKEPEPAKITQ
ncbi:MAG: DUF459 domain-containing protein [Rhizobiaceae bacterium]|nr:DUF459 domain-containing protein [Rhizobiaceae bacterium]